MGNTDPMSTQEPIQAQATRSFGDYLQGVWYAIDPQDGQLMALLGAGYFDTKGNPNLTRDRVDYRAGEVVTAASVGTRATMAKQENITPEEGYTPNYDKVEVPEKVTGTQRATTAGEENEATDGQVGTESSGDSGVRKSSGTRARQSRASRDG